MESIFFLFGLLGVVLVVHWAAVNDHAGNYGKTTGLFAMRDPETPPAKPQPGGVARRHGGPVASPATRQRRG